MQNFILGAVTMLAALLLISWGINYATRNSYTAMLQKRRALLDKYRAGMYGGTPLTSKEFAEMQRLNDRIKAREDYAPKGNIKDTSFESKKPPPPPRPTKPPQTEIISEPGIIVG